MAVLKVFYSLGMLCMSSQFVHAAECPSGGLQTAASILSDYAPAQSFCSSRFPLQTTTSTVTADPSTILMTVSTDLRQTTVSASTVTVTAPAQTSMVTAVIVTITTTDATLNVPTVITETVSVTVTVTRNAKRDAAPNTPAKTITTTTNVITKSTSAAMTSTRSSTNTSRPLSTTTTSSSRSPKEAAWSSVLSQASSIIGAICTCIESRPTAVITVSYSADTAKTVKVGSLGNHADARKTIPRTISLVTATTYTAQTATITV
ncbi:hypothetical protein B0A48_16835 [Cryoendolithus antarcticus]|uniref:Uncharacterized protein n=1 Tax=Cryoendolithus antarcticus TaxID=1507870 RepID=A0A1V8SDW8_9PEZI|nr:hypothetical protein B0A48_16835 [Cryoendolithus antarcticus]